MLPYFLLVVAGHCTYRCTCISMYKDHGLLGELSTVDSSAAELLVLSNGFVYLAEQPVACCSK